VNKACLLVGIPFFAIITFNSLSKTFAQDDEAIQLVVGFLTDADKDIRALAFEQIRSEVPGEAATKKFAELLPDLPPETQAGLLVALSDRGDKAAAPAVRDLLAKSDKEEVRIAAIKALGGLGEATDLATLIKFFSEGTPAEQAAARRSLVVLPGTEASEAMASELDSAATPVRVMLMETLTTRRARNTIPAIVGTALDDDPDARRAAMVALGQLAEADHISVMVQGVLKAEPGSEREAAEKAVMLACHRIPEPQEQVKPLLEAMDLASELERTILLSTLGRVGGPAALVVVEKAISDADTKQHEAGLQALCNWSDASIAFRLLELARTHKDDNHRRNALRALIRIAPLPDERSDQLRLDLLKTAMSMCREDSDRLQVLDRAKAVRAVETLGFIKPYLELPSYSEQASLSIVELAHHSGLRESNKAEFHAALDQVIDTSLDATVVDRARRYKKGETWVRPKE
jgi:HEAT repeat protein